MTTKQSNAPVSEIWASTRDEQAGWRRKRLWCSNVISLGLWMLNIQALVKWASLTNYLSSSKTEWRFKKKKKTTHNQPILCCTKGFLINHQNVTFLQGRDKMLNKWNLKFYKILLSSRVYLLSINEGMHWEIY